MMKMKMKRRHATSANGKSQHTHDDDDDGNGNGRVLCQSCLHSGNATHDVNAGGTRRNKRHARRRGTQQGCDDGMRRSV
jgi:hypothetical protein